LIIASNLLQGITRSCGCFQKDDVAARNRTHGLTDSPEYNSWHSMKQRCFDPHHTAYENYGGRGITVCDRWLHSFSAFYTDMGPRPMDSTLDRIDNDRGYEPDNCRWAMRLAQHNNVRRNRVVSFNGQSMTVAQWERQLGFTRDRIGQRIRDGWSIERALTEPVKLRNH